METRLKITGMSCMHCVRAAREALQSVDGVTGAQVDLESGSAVVTSDGHVDVQKLMDAVAEEGYTASLQS